MDLINGVPRTIYHQQAGDYGDPKLRSRKEDPKLRSRKEEVRDGLVSVAAKLYGA